MKVSYYNIGCKVNFAEISQIQDQFEKLGFETVEFGKESDIVIINTCTVTNKADADSRKIIRRAIRTAPQAYIIAIGCYAQLKPEDIGQIEGVNAIFGNEHKFDIPKFVKEYKKNKERSNFITYQRDIPFHSACSVDNESHTRIVLKIQDGCDYFCSYCAVAYARGKSRSMDFSELKKKIDELANTNFYEIVLSGINLGEYKSLTGEKFLDILKFIDDLDIKQRIRISSIEPNLLTDEIIDIVAKSSKICPHFHIPLQSGSDDILKAMRRKYFSEDFERLVIKIKNKIPDCCIGVDIITGFPGETDEDFNRTFTLIENLPISYIHPFTYSERDITIASKFPNKVNSKVQKERTIRLRFLSEIKKNDFYKSQLNSIKTIIPEVFDSENSFCFGWSENYIRVKFKMTNKKIFEPIKVKLLDLSDGIVVGNIQ